MEEESNNNKKEKNNKPFFSYSKYSSLAFQLIVLILLGIWGGLKLDEMAGFEKPVITVIISILVIVLSIYSVIISLK